MRCIVPSTYTVKYIVLVNFKIDHERSMKNTEFPQRKTLKFNDEVDAVFCPQDFVFWAKTTRVSSVCQLRHQVSCAVWLYSTWMKMLSHTTVLGWKAYSSFVKQWLLVCGYDKDGLAAIVLSM